MSVSQAELKARFENLAASYEHGSGGCTRQIAKHLLGMLSPIEPESVVHDNACGPLVVTSEIMNLTESQHIRPPTIKATDYAEAMVSICQALVSERQWTNVAASVMDAQDLNFEDESFSHSITNLGIFALPDPGKGVKEIYRTLKPGGEAIVTTWKDPGIMHHVHRIQKRIRPDLPLLYPVDPVWQEELTLRNALVKGGFNNSKIKITEKKAFMAAKDVDDLIDNMVSSSFWTTAQKGWTEEECKQWGEVAREELTEEQRKAAKIEMVAWIAVAEK